MADRDYLRMLRGEITTQEYCDRVAMEARRQESLDYRNQFRHRRESLRQMVTMRAKRIAQLVREVSR